MCVCLLVCVFVCCYGVWSWLDASIAQLGERQTEDLKVPGSIPGRGNFSAFCHVLSAVATATSIAFTLSSFERDWERVLLVFIVVGDRFDVA